MKMNDHFQNKERIGIYAGEKRGGIIYPGR